MKSTTVKAKPKSKSKHKTRRITIEPAENGFTVNHEQEQTPGPDSPYQPPTSSVHETKQGMLDHISSLIPDDQPAPDAGGQAPPE